ncbi:acyltransferase [Roseivirga sp.]|uniref:acyltransferase n=1 Tax=Roseivirga sp. TaxID=1964215 RepID=UPI003B8CD106
MIKKLLERQYKKIKGDQFELSTELSDRDLWIFAFQRCGMLIRGMLWYRRRIFAGRRVKLVYGHKVAIGRNSTLGRDVELSGLSKNGVVLGLNNNLGSGTIFKCTGVLTDLGEGIELGDNVAMGSNSYLGGYGGIKIGRDCIIGERFTVHSDNHLFGNTELPIRFQGTEKKPVQIGSDCWIGSNVCILGGVTVGEGCVIGAGSIVTKDLPPYSIAVGNPARVIKNRKDQGSTKAT